MNRRTFIGGVVATVVMSNTPASTLRAATADTCWKYLLVGGPKHGLEGTTSCLGKGMRFPIKAVSTTGQPFSSADYEWVWWSQEHKKLLGYYIGDNCLDPMPWHGTARPRTEIFTIPDDFVS